MRLVLILSYSVLFIVSSFAQQNEVRVVFCSDLHFGLKKAHFRNSKDSVTSEEVNHAMVEAIETLGKIDYLVITGDIANREETPIQSSSVSWQQFLRTYGQLHVPFLISPGNHDVSNAIGYYKPMNPLIDKTELVAIYNLTHNDQFRDTTGFSYIGERFNYSRDIAGTHFQFASIWPDSANRAWMEEDLKSVSKTTPVLIFAHDPPEGDPKHFKSPIGENNFKDKYENLLGEIYRSDYETEWDDFLKRHTNIKAYFHGHSNYQQFYTYKGVDGTLNLPCFRVDSPMKGKFSSRDESLLSFQVITIDSAKKTLLVRECFWNRGRKVVFGEEMRVKLDSLQRHELAGP